MARRALAGAVLLDLAVSPLFVWDVLAAPLGDELGRSAASLSVVYAVGLAAFTVGVLVGGRLADRHAPRALAVATAAGVGAGLALSAVAGSLLVLLLGFGVLLGGSTGVGYATAVRVAGSVAGARGLAVSMVVSAYAAGAVVLAPVADVLLERWGTTHTLGGLAVVLAAAVLGAAVLLPGSTPPAGTRSGPPGSLRPHRKAVTGSWLLFLLGSTPALVAFGHAGGLAGGTGHAAVAVLLLNVGNLAGRLLAGPAADRLGRAAVLHVMAGLLLAAVLALGVDPAPAVALAALLLIGAEYGAVSVLVPLTVRGAVPVDRFGTAYGLVFTGWGVAGLTAPVAAGLLVTATDYGTMAWALVVPALLFWIVAAVLGRGQVETADGSEASTSNS